LNQLPLVCNDDHEDDVVHKLRSLERLKYSFGMNHVDPFYCFEMKLHYRTLLLNNRDGSNLPMLSCHHYSMLPLLRMCMCHSELLMRTLVCYQNYGRAS
jgi:hypothetical protein